MKKAYIVKKNGFVQKCHFNGTHWINHFGQPIINGIKKIIPKEKGINIRNGNYSVTLFSGIVHHLEWNGEEFCANTLCFQLNEIANWKPIDNVNTIYNTNSLHLLGSLEFLDSILVNGETVGTQLGNKNQIGFLNDLVD